ncbi:LAFE_0F09164g1_1 [Lachancea fermentati]|uniref:LAFE_0F09164g1_1 n=1 Tax=Lachancea fermentati TaxID=4955 RepID=A0A1G4MFP0_LACFM|nr:LAFE_0F09164g1_1 [Lachancea fermentati]
MASQVKRKRNRVPLSCTICRKRKVKCDKTRPHCQQCSKTGVAHLCHYMEQTWAEEAEKELSKEAELKQLRERVKSLEETLSKIHSVSNNTPDSNTAVLDEPKLAQQNNYDNDELDLTRQFDMLHLKNNGTVHLGATHWLAIMKGDPYLKLLWSHIFTLREKLSEWYSQKRRSSGGGVSTGRCPVVHQAGGGLRGSVPRGPGVPTKNGEGNGMRKCPVDHQALMEAKGNANLMETQSGPRETGKCPINHGQSEERKCPVNHAQLEERKCPVSHGKSESKCPVDHGQREVPITQSGSFDVESKCPVNHSTGVNGSSTGCPVIPHTTSLPSFDKLTSKCPVIHDSTPPPPSSVPHIPEHITQEQAIARLCKLLPPKRIIALLLEKFFKYIYPVIPILDEQSFKSQTAQIIQTKDDVMTLKLTKPSDCCILGILVIILRITWLSLPQNACDIDLGPQCVRFFVPHVTTSTVTQSKEELLLMNFGTPSEAVHLVRKYLIKFDEITSFSNSSVNLTTVQFALFYKQYLMCCPDVTTDTQMNTFTSTSQDNETHQMLLSSIVQMAFSCGLHRDPDNFPQLTANTHGKLNKEAITNAERLKHTWRKTWYFIVSLDVQQSISLGAPRLLRNLRDFSDTKLPSTSKIDYVRDIKELIVVKNFTLFFQLDVCIMAVLNHILNVSMAKTVRKFELDSLIEILKELCFGGGNVNEVLNKLVNNGLLFTTEGSIDQTTDEIYTLPSLEQVLSPPPPTENEKDKKLNLPHEMTTRALFFSKHMTLRMLLYLLNYILFTHYEPKGNIDAGTRPLAKEYAQEALNYAMDGFRNCLLFFSNAKIVEGGNGSIFNYMEVALTPCCLDIGHRALQFMVCLILRAKCGPLTGMSESPVIASANNTSSSEDENDGKNGTGSKEGSVDSADMTKDISLDVGDELADILMARMVLFHKLTKQISNKYHYAKRMMKSTGFFITLLKNPSGKSGAGGKNATSIQKGLPKFQHPSIAKMSGFFKNVPSLVLSADGDQLRRCPVYQDALGFLPPRANSNGMPASQSSSVVQQLPPIRAYRPITYTSNDLRRTSDVRESDSKRRKLTTTSPSDQDSLPAGGLKAETPRVWSPLPVLQSASPPAPAMLGAGMKSELLPPLERVAGAFSPAESFKNSAVSISGSLGMQSPAAVSEVSSSVNYTPDFEDFLMQNSNFNGLMINPSSIVEAVGFENYSTQNNDGMGIATDFLPIDNSEIDGLAELSSTNGADFPIWE